MFFGMFFLLGILFLLYDGSVKRKLMAFVETMVITFSADVITTQIYFSIGVSAADLLRDYSLQRFVITFTCCLIQVPFVYFIRRIQRKLRLNLSAKQWVYMLIIILSQLFALFMYDFGMYENQYMNGIVVLAGIGFLIFDIWISSIIILLEVKTETEESIENMTEWCKMVTDYYLDVSDKMNRLSDSSEKYVSKLEAVYTLAGKEYESIKSHKDSEIPQCENKIVNSILKNVIMELERISCTYHIQFSIPDEINMEIMDLSSIIINMFDNAICAVEKCINEGKNEVQDISKSGINMGEKYHLRARAEYTDGIKIIKRIAEKYSGSMNIEYDDESFKNRAILKV